MVTYTTQDAERLDKLVRETIEFAKMGSRTAWKALQAIEPLVTLSIEQIAKKGGVQ